MTIVRTLPGLVKLFGCLSIETLSTVIGDFVIVGTVCGVTFNLSIIDSNLLGYFVPIWQFYKNRYTIVGQLTSCSIDSLSLKG